jgi:hypothetical protein
VRKQVSALAVVVAALAAAVGPSTASAIPLDLKTFTVSRSTTQAGAHPDLNIHFDMCDPPHGPGSQACSAPPIGEHEQIKDFTIGTPGGLLGNINAVPYCEYNTWLTLSLGSDFFLHDSCPLDSKLGFTTGHTELGPSIDRTNPGNIYNVRPIGSEPARFGAIVHPDGNFGEPAVFQPTHFKVRTDGDFGLDAVSPNVFKELPSGQGGSFLVAKIRDIDVEIFGQVGARNFLTNPTNCESGPDQVVTVDANSWQDPDRIVSRSAPLISTGCENVPFDPSIDVQRETAQAGAPSGYTVGVNFPDSEEDPIHQSHLKNAEVTLPEGVVLNPAAAANLDACSEEQFGLGNDDPTQCPPASDIGDLKVSTPLLDGDMSDPDIDPLTGNVYFAEPTASEPWRIFLNISDGGLEIKLEGKTEIDEQTGQIKTTFLDNPQTPFTRFELSLRGGPDAILQNPVACGSHTVHADFLPWARPNDPPSHGTFSFDTTGCTTPTPFSPQIPDASTNPTQAGAETVSKLVIDRPDGHQLIKNMNIKLPGGLVGRLTGNPLCPAASAGAGTCTQESKVGSVKVDVGAGPAPIKVGGEIFLTEPLQAGDAAGLSIVVPAKTGPIDLGNVVTTSRVTLRQSDGGIDVVTGDLPEFLAGVYLPVRRVEVLVDRKGFFQNPTSCAPKTLLTDFTSHGAATAQGSFTAAATGCEQLPFAPKLSMSVGPKSQTGISQKPQLTAVVTQDPGQSGISRAEVLLPQVLRPDVTALNSPGKLCRSEQLAENACPPRANIGQATVNTPLLPQPLSGPVYIVQDPNPTNPLPRLVVRLGGMVSIDLNAGNSIKGVRTLNTFENVPDVPQSRFELTVVGGREGILKNFVDLCDNPDHADAKFFGHSGAVFSDKPALEVAGCTGGVTLKLASARVDRRGRVGVDVTCTLRDDDCSGRLAVVTGSGKSARQAATIGSKKFAITSGDKRRIKVKLKRRALRQLRRRGRLKARIEARLSEVRASVERRSVNLKAPKKAKRRR